jgi:hypothetical protein
MNEAKLPPLPPYIYGRECSENERVWPESLVREYGALCARQERERCVEACKSVLEMKEEARADQASRDARGADVELGRLKHWLTVSTYNAGIRRCIAAILSALEDKK